MKRTAKYALSAALTAVFVVPAFADDTPFPDTKENHWAYEAVTHLKAEGILVGYPNGNFIGNRLASRYEMAVAINAAYTKLKSITDGLAKQIDDINSKISDLQSKGSPSQADLDALKAALSDVKDQVSGVKSYGQDIADLKKLSDKFEKDLAAIGVDVDDLKKGLASLDKRVAALEAHKPPVDIHGEINTVSLNGYSTSHNYGVDETGRPTGYGRGSAVGYPVGADQDFTFLHEIALDLKTTNDSGPKGVATIVLGNMLGSTPSSFGLGGANAPFGNQSTQLAGVPYGEGNESIYIQKAYGTFDWAAAGFSGTVEAGRIPLKLGSYILERPDYTPYYKDARWDNGAYDVDGAKLSFKVGGVGIHVFAARANNNTDSFGTPVQTITAGSSYATASGVTPYGVTGNLATIDQLLGAHLWVPIGKMGDVDLSYVLLDSDNFFTDASFTGSANRIADYGGDVHLKFNNIKVWGGYSKTDVFQNTHSLLTKHNQRYDGYASYDADKWGLTGGYRKIDPYFGAPGYWGHIGTWWNPTDVEGFDAKGHLDLASIGTLKGTFGYWTGTGEIAGGLPTGTKITSYSANLEHKFGSNYGINLGFEEVDWNLKGGTGKPHERWYDIGLNYDFSEKTSLSVLWQISDYNGQGQAGFNLFQNSPYYGAAGSSVAKGGLITTQFSIKF